MVICALSLGCMNYIFGKKFLVFYEIFQFPTSRGPFLGKFDFYQKNQETTFLLKKNFFFSIGKSRGTWRPSGEGFKDFQKKNRLGISQNADPPPSGLKIQILLNKPKLPHIKVRKPHECVNSHFLAIFHHIRPKKQHMRKICTPS